MAVMEEAAAGPGDDGGETSASAPPGESPLSHARCPSMAPMEEVAAHGDGDPSASAPLDGEGAAAHGEGVTAADGYPVLRLEWQENPFHG